MTRRIEATEVRGRTLSLLFTALVVSGAARDAHAEDDLGNETYAQFELHASFLSGVADRSILGTTFGYAARAGFRVERWGAFLTVEQNLWVTSDGNTGVRGGALNIGVGGEFIYANGHVRASMALGPSILLHRTLLDDPGSTGIFFDIRPAGLRFPIIDDLRLCFDPISLAIVMPVLSGIPLVMVEYRTTLTAEYHW